MGIYCINHSQIHECRNLEPGRTVSFLGIHNRIFGTVKTLNRKVSLILGETYYDAERHLKDILTTELLIPNPCLCVCLSTPLPLSVLYETVRFPSFMGGLCVSRGGTISADKTTH